MTATKRAKTSTATQPTRTVPAADTDTANGPLSSKGVSTSSLANGRTLRDSMASSTSSSSKQQSKQGQGASKQVEVDQKPVNRGIKRVNPISRRILKDPPASNVFRILLATDIHLGYAENEPLRRDDSFNTFEEILQSAVENQVDFVLLGGDLFHDNKPSRATLYRATQTLSKYVLGDKQILFNIISDPHVNFPTNGKANFMDPNVNIQLPIFSIHGNHDDPSGLHSLSTMDLLHQDFLLNYFSKATQIDQLTIHPIIMKKDDSTLFLYGIPNIRDERLYRAFQANQVKFADVDKQDPNTTYQLAVVHQNRIKHTATATDYLPESFLPSWLNFVFWGHEHECRVHLEENVEHEFQIFQGGSSVATSLIAAEAVPKHVGILETKQEKHRFYPVPLYTTRPFETADIRLADELDPDDADSHIIEELLAAQVEAMLERIHNNPAYQNEDRPMPPLVRLRVDHTDFPRINTARFGQQFVTRIANADDILLWQKQRSYNALKDADSDVGVKVEGSQQSQMLTASDADSTPPIFALVNDIINRTNPLSLISQYKLADAVHEYVERKEVHAISSIVEDQLKNMRLTLKKDRELENDEHITDDQIASVAKKHHHIISQHDEKEAVKAGTAITASDPRYNFQLDKLDLAQLQADAESRSHIPDDHDEEGDRDIFGSDDSDEEGTPKSSRSKAKGKAARGGRGSRGGRGGAGGGRGGKKAAKSSSSAAMDVDVESDDSEATPVVKRERGASSKEEADSSGAKSSSGRRLPTSIAGGKGRSTKTSNASTSSSRLSQHQQVNKRGKIGQLEVSQRNDNEVIDIE